MSELLKNFDEIKEKNNRNKYIKEIHNLLENNLKYTVSTTEGQPPIRAKVKVKGDHYHSNR